MKRIILTVILVASVMSLVAQNHRHFLSLTTESIVIGREYGAMYEFKTTTTTDGSRFNTINIINKRFLYTIPERLKSLDTDEIDDIMRKGKKIEKFTWSWFIIWQTTYSKDSVSDKFSFFAVRVLILSFIGMIVSMWLLGYMFSKNKISLWEMLFVMEDKEIWAPISAAVGTIAFMPVMFFYETDVILPFIFIPYALPIGYVWHLLSLWYRKYHP